MNVKLLRKVQKHILEEPKRFVMDSWMLRKDIDGDAVYYGFQSVRPFPSCNTVGCFAGWTCELAGQKRVRNFFLRARKALGLTPAEAERLFQPDQWPDQFLAGTKDDGKKETVKVAAARIDHFIKTEGRE